MGGGLVKATTDEAKAAETPRDPTPVSTGT